MSSSIAEPKWRRIPEERPQQIVDAALAVFGEHGLRGARLEDIAKRAGVSKGTIYLYFPNKEELFREVVRLTCIACLDEAEHEFTEIGPQHASDQLRKYIASWWNFLRTPEYQTVNRLVVSELHHFPDLVEFYATEVVQRAHALSGQLIQRAIDAGELRRMDAHVAVRMLSGMLRSQAVWCAFRQHYPNLVEQDDDVVLQQTTDFFFYAMRPETDGASTTGK